jgi:hypothetical protein
MTGQEAMEAAHLANWNVRKMALVIPQEPVITARGVTTPAPIAVPDMFATVRDNPIVAGQVDYLGVVGTKYEPVQNEASCAVLDAITDESGAHFETAGALKGGRETFVSMKLPKTMTFEGRDGSKDRTDWYLAALNSYHGYLPLTKTRRHLCVEGSLWTHRAAIRPLSAVAPAGPGAPILTDLLIVHTSTAPLEVLLSSIILGDKRFS